MTFEDCTTMNVEQTKFESNGNCYENLAVEE
jgi:hypothetical protein